MKRVTRIGYEDALFSTWCTDPDFVLNRPPFDHGTILVAGSEFGVGSSRGHAVWTSMDFGFRVVVSSQFADIFRSDAGKSGTCHQHRSTSPTSSCCGSASKTTRPTTPAASCSTVSTTSRCSTATRSAPSRAEDRSGCRAPCRDGGACGRRPAPALPTPVMIADYRDEVRRDVHGV